MNLPELFATAPAVYAVGHDYQIFVPVTQESLMWVKVGAETFYDHSNGVLRSHSSTHRMVVPMAALDKAKEYTICYRIVNERKPYRSDVTDVESITFRFRPVTGPEIRLYHIADAHNCVAAPVAAGSYFGDALDLLILNGDVPEDSGNIANFKTIHEIAGQLTGGGIPAVFSRGNHDTRGIYAEALAEHTACNNGVSYYTFRIGPMWGIVLDCGEDKCDDHEEYGHTICCEAFRQQETAFLKQVIANAKDEYEAEGVQYKVVISHVPFGSNLAAPFDIEIDTYREWCRLLKENVKPHLMLAGHIHRAYVVHAGDELDHNGVPCPMAVLSQRKGGNRDYFAGGAVTFAPGKIEILITDSEKNILGSETIEI